MPNNSIEISSELEYEYVHPFWEFWYAFRSNKLPLIGFCFIIFIIFVAIFADFIAPHSYTEQYRDALLQPPFWQGGDISFILGTDDLGRDILSRLIYGARLSISMSLISVVLSVGIGISLGLVAGYFRGTIEIVIMRTMDIMMAIPSLLLAVAIVAILGPSLLNAALAIGVVLLPGFVRLTRASTIVEAQKDYVISSRISGAGKLRMMFITILPNCVAPLIVQATLSFSNAILDLAALGFLGLGAQPPDPEWGSMLANSRSFLQRAWWVVTFPGLTILLSVLALNIMGDGLRDTLDPKMKT